MKKIFFLITLFIFFIQACISPVFADIEPVKVMSLHYDDSSALVYITVRDPAQEQRESQNLKYISLSNPNRIYFDINDAILIGEKQQLVFERSNIKEIRLSQFDTNPDIVRAVITFEEDFDISKLKLFSIDGNIILKVSPPEINNDYFNTIYDDSSPAQVYQGIKVSSLFIRKTSIPETEQENKTEGVINDIQQAFENTTLANTDGKTYDSVVSADLSANLKLRTKYFINQYISKKGGLLVSGLGQATVSKIFYLTSPKRMVIDLPNTFLDKSIRNKEISICPGGSCKDTAKIGQFEYNTARIVITSDKAEKYIPVYSKDSQSLLLADTGRLDHTSLSQEVSNLNKVFVRKIDSKTNELILSFTSPVVHSIIRHDNSLNLYLFNVKSYNEQDLIKTLNNTYYKQLVFSLLPKVGIRAGMSINKDDIVRIEQSVDSRALKITIKSSAEETRAEKLSRKGVLKNKIVLDAGHGGSDYGAIREGINEKDITLDVVQRIDTILRAKGYKTALTRSDDTFVSLSDRVDFSENEEPEIFVSIHVNSAVSPEPSGIETHYYHDYSKNLAETVHKHLIKDISSKDRGLFKSKFYVINHTTVPAILVEIGFISNDGERNELITDSRKQKTAKAIADGIIEYLKANGGKK